MQLLLTLFFTVLLSPLFFSGAVQAQPTQGVAEDKHSARILAYFMIGENDNPNASVSLEQFEIHLQTLKNDSVPMALPDIVAAWKQEKPLPDKTTAITFDGGHRSVLTQALPLLEKHKIPFTVFVASDLADIGAPQYLSWEDVKKLQKNDLATIGMHTASYENFLYAENFSASLNKARARFREQMGNVPKYFSFPQGAYNDVQQELIEKQGFISVGQHSGVAYTATTVLPRFTMNTYFSDETRLTMILNALPLPVSDKTPEPSMRSSPKDSITSYGFTALHGNKDIRCHSSDEDVTLEKVNDKRVEIRTTARLTDSRLRINCTQKANKDEGNAFRWMGFLAVR